MTGKEKGAKGGSAAGTKGGLEGKNAGTAVNFNDVMNEIRNTVT